MDQLHPAWPDTGLSSPRYTARAFPGYRFIPGVHPHPTADPHGHSFRSDGSTEPRVGPVDPGTWSDCEPYLYGVDLYNHGFWWEAHEAWESVWREADRGGVQRQYLKGLIQVSACHLKIQLGHAAGVERLRRDSLRHLAAVLSPANDPTYMGLDVADFVRRVQVYFDACSGNSERPPAHDLTRYPFIRLEGR